MVIEICLARMTMTKISKSAVLFSLFATLFLHQGCVIWIPLDVDYDVEIELNERRPNMVSDVGFIHYECVGRSSGYHFYSQYLNANQLKLFLLPKKLYDEYRYNYISACDVAYPKDSEINSFQHVDLSEFKASVGECFNRRYRLYRNAAGVRRYGCKNTGFPLSMCSCKFDFLHTDEETNIAMEHSLQAILLRARYPRCPALHEKIVFLKDQMLTTNPQFPITTIQKLDSGVRYELLTDTGVCVASVTVRYPFYIYLSTTDFGEDAATHLAMSSLLTMYCDLSKNGIYKGTITSFIPFLGRDKPIAKASRFIKVVE